MEVSLEGLKEDFWGRQGESTFGGEQLPNFFQKGFLPRKENEVQVTNLTCAKLYSEMVFVK